MTPVSWRPMFSCQQLTYLLVSIACVVCFQYELDKNHTQTVKVSATTKRLVLQVKQGASTNSSYTLSASSADDVIDLKISWARNFQSCDHGIWVFNGANEASGLIVHGCGGLSSPVSSVRTSGRHVHIVYSLFVQGLHQGNVEIHVYSVHKYDFGRELHLAKYSPSYFWIPRVPTTVQNMAAMTIKAVRTFLAKCISLEARTDGAASSPSEYTTNVIDLYDGPTSTSVALGYCDYSMSSTEYAVYSSGEYVTARILRDVEGFWLVFLTSERCLKFISHIPRQLTYTEQHDTSDIPRTILCVWKIEEVKKRIIVKTSEVKLDESKPCSEALVSAYDGSDFTSPITTWCNSHTSVVTSSKDSLLMVLSIKDVRRHSQTTVSFGYITEDENDPNLHCGNGQLTLTSSSITVSSPASPFYYPNNMRCEWNITSVAANSTIKIAPQYMYIYREPGTPCQDYLRIVDVDARDSSTQILLDHCGTSQVPMVITSSGRHVSLTFVSDHKYTSLGFKLSVSPVITSPPSFDNKVSGIMDNGSMIGIIVGIVVSTFILLIVLIVGVQKCRQRRRLNRRQQQGTAAVVYHPEGPASGGSEGQVTISRTAFSVSETGTSPQLPSYTLAIRTPPTYPETVLIPPPYEAGQVKSKPATPADGEQSPPPYTESDQNLEAGIERPPPYEQNTS